MSDTIKTEKTRVRITSVNPSRQPQYKAVETDGVTIPGRDGLAVSRDCGKGRLWTITHLPSGLYVGWSYERKGEAVKAMAKLYALDVPWQMKAKYVRRLVLGNPKRATALYRALYGND